jgi:AraC family transcriptional regulator
MILFQSEKQLLRLKECAAWYRVKKGVGRMVQIDTGILDLEQPPILLDSGCRRNNTAMMRYQAVQRAIVTMQERYMDQLTLQEIADAAQLSPFHFNRVFRSMIGVSPSLFLAAIRMREAKRLLLTTNHSITSVCFDVGYISLGTFTFRFTLLVGLSPSRFRQMAQEEIMRTSLGNLQHVLANIPVCQARAHGDGIRGTISTATHFNGLIFVGLFSGPLPQGKPVACSLLTSAGRYCLPPVPDGQYYLFGAAVEQSQDFFSVLAQGPHLHGGREVPPICVHNGSSTVERDILLVQPSWADPPIVVAFPWLFLQEFHHYANSHG